MSRGSRVRSPPEADTFTAVHREYVGFGIRYDFDRIAVYLSFRTPIGGSFPPLAAPLGLRLSDPSIDRCMPLRRVCCCGQGGEEI